MRLSARGTPAAKDAGPPPPPAHAVRGVLPPPPPVAPAALAGPYPTRASDTHRAVTVRPPRGPVASAVVRRGLTVK